MKIDVSVPCNDKKHLCLLVERKRGKEMMLIKMNLKEAKRLWQGLDYELKNLGVIK